MRESWMIVEREQNLKLKEEENVDWG